MHAEHKYHISTNERLIVYCRLTGLFTNAARGLIKKGAIFHCGGQEWEVGTYEGYDRWNFEGYEYCNKQRENHHRGHAAPG